MEGRVTELVRDVQNKLYSALRVEANRGYGHWDSIMGSDGPTLKGFDSTGRRRFAARRAFTTAGPSDRREAPYRVWLISPPFFTNSTAFSCMPFAA